MHLVFLLVSLSEFYIDSIRAQCPAAAPCFSNRQPWQFARGFCAGAVTTCSTAMNSPPLTFHVLAAMTVYLLKGNAYLCSRRIYFFYLYILEPMWKFQCSCCPDLEESVPPQFVCCGSDVETCPYALPLPSPPEGCPDDQLKFIFMIKPDRIPGEITWTLKQTQDFANNTLNSVLGEGDARFGILVDIDGRNSMALVFLLERRERERIVES